MAVKATLIKKRTLRRYLKKLSEDLKHIKEEKFQSSECNSVNIYFEDESRFGLMTIARRILTVSGVKPILPFQHRFKNLYLFGAYSPITGAHFTLEMPECNADCFQVYLNEFSQQSPNEFKIIILDNGAFHKAKHIEIPPNIQLLFLPPYCPELNPAEKMWRHFKDAIANTIFKTIDDLSDRLMAEVNKLKSQTIISITSYDYYRNAYYAVF